MEEAENVAPGPASDFDGTYRLLGEIKSGSRSVVYHAEQQKLGQEVAIKVMRARLPAEPMLREELNDELRALSALDHANLVAISGFGIVGDSPYIAMEMLTGETLAKRLADGPLEPALAEELILAMLRALAYLHVRGIVHRNLTPSAVFLQKDGESGVKLKLIDYGLARLPANQNADQTLLAPAAAAAAYMSPEQIAGEDIDARSDVFAAGAIMLEMMAGDLVHVTSDERSSGRTLHAPQPVAAASQEFHAFISHALETEKHERFGNADQMLRALLQLPTPWFERTNVDLKDEAPAPPPTPDAIKQDGTSEFPLHVEPEPDVSPLPPALPARRRRTSRKLMAAGALVALGAGGWTLWERLREPPALADTQLATPDSTNNVVRPRTVQPAAANEVPAAPTLPSAVARNEGAATGPAPSPIERATPSAHAADTPAIAHAAQQPPSPPTPAANAQPVQATQARLPEWPAFPAPLARDPRSGPEIQPPLAARSESDPSRLQLLVQPPLAAPADQPGMPPTATQLTASAHTQDPSDQAASARGPQAQADAQHAAAAQPSAADPHAPPDSADHAQPGADTSAAQAPAEAHAAAATPSAKANDDWPPRHDDAPAAKPSADGWPPPHHDDAPAAKPVEGAPPAEAPAGAAPEQIEAAPPLPPAAKPDGSIRHVKPSANDIHELLSLVHSTDAPRGVPSDPWTGPLPVELEALRDAIAKGDRGSPQHVGALRRYSRHNPEDAHGHLLLAGIYRNRGWSADALDQYELAYRKDPSARGAPEMLTDTLKMVTEGVAEVDATRFIARSYQREALPAIDLALRNKGLDAAASARLKKLRARIASGPR